MEDKNINLLNVPDNMYFSGKAGIYLYPNEKQKVFIDKCIEGYRITFNWGLSKEYENYELFKKGIVKKEFLSYFDLTKLYSGYYKSHDILKDIPVHSMYNALRDLIKGFTKYFNAKGIGVNLPKYKHGGELIDTFRPRSELNRFYFENNLLHFEGCSDKYIETSYYPENQSRDVHYYMPTIKRNNRTEQYMISFLTLESKLDSYFIENNIPKSSPIGVDINKKIMYACSNGMMIDYVDTSRLEVGLVNINRKVENDRKLLKEKRIENPDAVMSNNAKFRLTKRKHLFERIANIHMDTAYKGSLEIIRLNPECIIIEDLDLKYIMSRHFVAKELQNHPLGKAQRILKEQAFKYNIPIVCAPALFPSSKYCSNCATYKDIGSNEYFICPNCGSRIQRDLNAAINLKKWYTKELRYKNTSTGTYF